MGKIAVLCVDDNQMIGDSIERLVQQRPQWEWLGWLPSAEGVVELVREAESAVVLVDVDLPGEDSFLLVRTIARECPHARVLMLSGHLSASLVDRAFDMGAWGYLSKSDDTQSLAAAVERVASGEVVLSAGAIEGLGRG